MEDGATAAVPVNGTATYFSCRMGKRSPFSVFGHTLSSYIEEGTRLDVSTSMTLGCSASWAAGHPVSQDQKVHLSPPVKALLTAKGLEKLTDSSGSPIASMALGGCQDELS